MYCHVFCLAVNFAEECVPYGSGVQFGTINKKNVTPLFCCRWIHSIAALPSANTAITPF
jgi:hypothetical protein